MKNFFEKQTDGYQDSIRQHFFRLLVDLGNVVVKGTFQ